MVCHVCLCVWAGYIWCIQTAKYKHILINPIWRNQNENIRILWISLVERRVHLNDNQLIAFRITMPADIRYMLIDCHISSCMKLNSMSILYSIQWNAISLASGKNTKSIKSTPNNLFEINPMRFTSTGKWEIDMEGKKDLDLHSVQPMSTQLINRNNKTH